MKRLILTTILGILIMSLAGCVGYRQHHHWHGRRVVVVNRPKHPPVPPVHPRHSHRHHAPHPVPRRHYHKF